MRDNAGILSMLKRKFMAWHQIGHTTFAEPTSTKASYTILLGHSDFDVFKCYLFVP